MPATAAAATTQQLATNANTVNNVVCGPIHKPVSQRRRNMVLDTGQNQTRTELDDCVVWNAHNMVFGSKRSAIRNLCTSCLLPAFDDA